MFPTEGYIFGDLSIGSVENYYNMFGVKRPFGSANPFEISLDFTD